MSGTFSQIYTQIVFAVKGRESLIHSHCEAEAYKYTTSNDYINGKGFVNGKFSWQEGFGAFSYTHSDLTQIIKYIENQKMHHSMKSFRDEYVELLKEFEIDSKPEYLYNWID